MTGADDAISHESRVLAGRVRARAASMLGPDMLAGLAAHAIGRPDRDMTAAEIRALAADAIAQAQKVSYLLGRLAALLDEPA